ncbi:hypothetical protein AJ78_00513 [Emergomyces pasteurianus Ep9510]|uniref:Mid2 domain-containing protein n=1 Tax=Emergomyces pasteurianus Ep9510 TaxID=1447872 RepID=A0A1J9PTE4_9EURO|nr:hypothetical protein AJ78_00513 [Emergomyces pasteurianus Ep9510]
MFFRQRLISIAWVTVAPVSYGYSLTSHQAISIDDGPRHRVAPREMEIIPGSVGDIDTDRDWSQSGKGSFNISQGGIIAIAVIVGIVVILGTTSAILFFIAKKRSWEIRASIRRSAKRLTAPMTPRRFSTAPTSSKPRNREASMRIPAHDTHAKQKPKLSPQQSKSDGSADKHTSRKEILPPFDRDVEKAADAKSPTGKSEFEPSSPRGWKQMLPFGSTR